MSVAAMKWAYAQTGTSPTAQAVLALLAFRFNDAKGCCYPGVGRIASDTNLGRSTVLRALSELEERGLISIEKRGGSGSGRQTNVYRLPAFQASEAKSQNETLPTGGKVPERDQQSPALTPAKSRSDTQKGSRKGSHKERESVASRRFPNLWEPKKETRALLSDRGFPGTLVETVLQKIKAYRFEKPVTDYDARFIQWVEREKPSLGDSGVKPSATEQLRQLAASHGLSQRPGETEEHFRQRVVTADTQRRYSNGRTTG